MSYAPPLLIELIVKIEVKILVSEYWLTSRKNSNMSIEIVSKT
jgi:hypothetical protein